MEEAPQKVQTHVVILPTPGMGHLIPLIELARKLLQLNGRFAITSIIPDDGLSTKPQKELLQTSPSINSIFLPHATTDDKLPDDAKIETRILLSLIRSTPSLCAVLRELKESGRLSAFLVDIYFMVPDAQLEITVVRDWLQDWLMPDGTLVIYDSNDPASSTFICTSRFKALENSIVKLVWVPPAYGDTVACITDDGTLSL